MAKTKINLLVTYEIPKCKNKKELKQMITECKNLVRQNANWNGVAKVTNAIYFQPTIDRLNKKSEQLDKLIKENQNEELSHWYDLPR